LEIASRLYFNSADEISIHTLVHAAHTVLDDIAKTKDIKSIKTNLIERVNPEYKKEFISELHKAATFFKHAVKDPDESIEFDARLSEIQLFDAINIYKSLTGDSPFWLNAFYVWYIRNNPGIIEINDNLELQKALDNLLSRKFASRRGYIESILAIQSELFVF
jgi:hypothetical protein